MDEKERERERDRETGGKGKKKRIKEIKGGEKRREERARVVGWTRWNGSWKGEVRKDACSPGQRNLYTHAHARVYAK